MSTNYWQLVTRSAYLSDDFGLELALKKFGLTKEELIAKVGLYSRGKRKGLPKGKIVWSKVIKGGWVKTGPYDFEQMRAQGFVAKPGRCFGFVIVDSYSEETILVHPETDVHSETTSYLNTERKRASL